MTDSELIQHIFNVRKKDRFLGVAGSIVFSSIGLLMVVLGLMRYFEGVNYFIAFLGLVLIVVFAYLFYSDSQNKFIEYLVNSPEQFHKIKTIVRRHSALKFRRMIVLDKQKQTHFVPVDVKYYPELIRLLFKKNPKIKLSQAEANHIRKLIIESCSPQQVEIFEEVMQMIL